MDLIPKKKWRSQFKTKDQLIAAMGTDLSKIPGVIWNFSQPIEDNVEEMLSGVKGEMAVKLYGPDLFVLDEKAKQIQDAMSKVRGVEDLGIFQELGQPNVNIIVNRDKIARYGLNISDVQGVIQTAVGGSVEGQVVEGEKTFDIAVRYQPQFRETIDEIRHITVATPDGYRVPLEALCDFKLQEGPSVIYREANSRYIAIKFSVRNRDLGSTIAEAQQVVKNSVLLQREYHIDWSGEFESQKRSAKRLALVVPITIVAIFFVLFLVFGSTKWAFLIMADLAMASIGGCLALFVTGNNFSVSSGIGFLALFGVSVQTGMLLVSYIHQMRLKGMDLRRAVMQGARRRLRPIMMTALVATLGLLPAAMSHAIGSDSQRPMAIVIVGGLLADLVMGFFLIPTLYHWVARKNDTLKY